MSPWVWTVVFLFSGILFAILELFLPSGGILAFFSFAAFCAGVVFAFHQSMEFGLAFLGFLLVGLPVLVWQLFAIWPHTPIGRRMLLEPENDPALAPDPEKDSLQNLIGQMGIAKSRMMPSGIVLLDGIKYDALSEGEPIDPEAKVVVVQASKLNIIVRAVSNRSSGINPKPPAENESVIIDPFQNKS